MTKEQLTAWMVSNLTLSRDDLKFFSFVADKSAAQQPITSAQNELWHRLLRKYYRQLRKAFADEKIKQIEQTDWVHAPVQTVRFNKLAVVSINGDAYLSIKTPYNKTINARIQSGLMRYVLKYNSAHGWYFLFSHEAAGDLLSFANTVFGRNQYTVCPLLREYIATINRFGSRRLWAVTVRDVNGRAIVAPLAQGMLEHLPAVDDWSIAAVKKYSDLGIALHPGLRRRLRAKYGRNLLELTCIRQPTVSVRAASLEKVCDVVYEYAVAHQLGLVAICTGSVYVDTVVEVEYQSLTDRLHAVGIAATAGLRGSDEPVPDLIIVSTLMHVAYYAPFYPSAKIIVVSNSTISTRFINPSYATL